LDGQGHPSPHEHEQKQKPLVLADSLNRARFAGTDEGVRPYARLAFVQQHAFGFLRIHRTVVQLVRFEEDLDERRSGGDRALDQGF
jgi:hypothetical protein